MVVRTDQARLWSDLMTVGAIAATAGADRIGRPRRMGIGMRGTCS
jgi:hypothetical protein